MSSEPTTVAFIGAAHIHTPGFIGMINKRPAGEVRVKYVYDHDPRRSEKRASELAGAQAVSDPKAILDDPEVKGVIICSETTEHEKLVLAAAAAKKNMFVEKPLGYAASDANKMAAAVERAGVIFQTGYFSRGNAQLQFLKQQIAAGSFGKITRARGSNCHSGALGGWFDSKPNDPAGDWRWMADPKVSGVGGFGDLGTHSLDILIWLLGDVEAVTAQLDNGTARYPGCDEIGEGLIRFKSGVIATLAAGWDDVANPVSYLISGTEGHAAIIDGKLYFKCDKLKEDGKQPIHDDKMPKGWPHAFENFLDALAGKPDAKERLVTVREAAYRSAVMESLYRGAQKGQWVKV